MKPAAPALFFRIRLLVAFFIAGLALSGITAFPLVHELNLLASWIGADLTAQEGSLRWWIAWVREGLVVTNHAYPFLAYGTDWLAFGHLVIALFFIGAWRDPVRNLWIFHAGLIACAGVVPLAMIAGAVRGIPVYWRLIDCSFGIFGAIPLWLALRWTRQLEQQRAAPQE